MLWVLMTSWVSYWFYVALVIEQKSPRTTLIAVTGLLSMLIVKANTQLIFVHTEILHLWSNQPFIPFFFMFFTTKFILFENTGLQHTYVMLRTTWGQVARSWKASISCSPRSGHIRQSLEKDCFPSIIITADNFQKPQLCMYKQDGRTP